MPNRGNWIANWLCVPPYRFALDTISSPWPAWIWRVSKPNARSAGTLRLLAPRRDHAGRETDPVQPAEPAAVLHLDAAVLHEGNARLPAQLLRLRRDQPELQPDGRAADLE